MYSYVVFINNFKCDANNKHLILFELMQIYFLFIQNDNNNISLSL
jgi:hypothetical protein